MLAVDAGTYRVDEALEHFRQYGYARLGPVLSATGRIELRLTVEQLMSGKLKYPGMFFQHDSSTGRYQDLQYGKGWIGPSTRYRKIERLELDLLFWRWICNPLFARIAQSHLGPSVSLYRAVLWNKAPTAGTELPWHQDDGKFWGIDRAPSLQIWTALDDVPVASGCVQVFPGTHHQGLASAEGGTVQAHDVARQMRQSQPVDLPARAGEAMLIHNHTWHRSGHNQTQLPRRALGISYLEAGTRCLRKRRAPRRFLSVFDRPVQSSSS